MAAAAAAAAAAIQIKETKGGSTNGRGKNIQFLYILLTLRKKSHRSSSRSPAVNSRPHLTTVLYRTEKPVGADDYGPRFDHRSGKLVLLMSPA